MRLPNLARWLRTRNAAIRERNTVIRIRRAADAARFKGVVGIEDQTPDDLMAVADEVAETLCRRRWDVAPPFTGRNGQHLCVVAIPEHGYHECACGAWRMEIGATP